MRVNGNTGPLVNLSDVVSDLLEWYKNELLQNNKYPCAIGSTEELLYIFEEYNKNVESETENPEESRRFVASLDVEKLYQSMKTRKCVDVIKEVVTESKIVIKNLDVRELSVFLRKNMSNEELEDKGLLEFVPKQKKRKKKPVENEKKTENENEEDGSKKNKSKGKQAQLSID